MLSLFSRRASASAPSSGTGSEEPTSSWRTPGDTSTASTSGGPQQSSAALVRCANIAALPETRRLVVTAALDRLFTNQWFDICTLRGVSELMGLSTDSEAYKALHTLHCVHYNKMNPELRDLIPELVREALNPPTYEENLATLVAMHDLKF